LSGKSLAKVVRLTEQDVAADLGDAVAAVTFDDLAIEQAGIDAPGAAAFIGGLHPGSEMGRERIEVERQAITGEDGQTIWGQTLGDLMDQLMSEILSARAKGKGRDKLRTGIAGDPEPFGLSRAIEFQAELIELDMGQM